MDCVNCLLKGLRLLLVWFTIFKVPVAIAEVCTRPGSLRKHAVPPSTAHRGICHKPSKSHRTRRLVGSRLELYRVPYQPFLNPLMIQVTTRMKTSTKTASQGENAWNSMASPMPAKNITSAVRRRFTPSLVERNMARSSSATTTRVKRMKRMRPWIMASFYAVHTAGILLAQQLALLAQIGPHSRRFSGCHSGLT